MERQVENENRPSISTEKVLCDICGSPVWPTNLRKHMKSHADDANKPKNCTYCNKEFPTYMRMTRHRKIAHAQQYAVDRDTLMKQEGSKYLGIEHPSKKWHQMKKKEKMLEKMSAK